MGLQVVLVDELPMEFHCDLQLKDRSLTVNGIASGAGGGVADGVPLCFATVGSFPQCLEGFKCFGGRAEDVIPLCFARDCC